MTLACDTGDPLVFFAGDTWTILGEFTLDGAPVDLTGQTVKVFLKASQSDLDTAAVFEYDYAVPAGAPAVAGKATIVVPSNLTGVNPAAYFLKVKTVAPGTPPVIQSYGYTNITVSL